MRISFRQGLVRAPTDFLLLVNQSVTLQVPPRDSVIVAFADGSTDYLFTESQTIPRAWAGPFQVNVNYWLYWDIHLVTGARSFGYTVYEPIEGPTQPTKVPNGQHWFDTTAKQMKVFNAVANQWQRVIRVFAAQLAQGGVFIPMTNQTNVFTGTQVGLDTPTTAGALVYDNFGGVLKKKDGTYYTTEDYALTGVANSSQVKIGSIQIRAEAAESIPAMSIVRFTDFNTVSLASNHIIDKVVYGIVEFDAIAGDAVNVTLDGMIHSDSWDWIKAGASINSPLYTTGTGMLTLTPTIPLKPVAVVVDKNAILLRPSSLFITGEENVLERLEGTATGDIFIPSGYKLQIADAPVTPTDVVNKQYVDTLFAQAGDRVYAKVNADTIALMKGMPIYVTADAPDDMKGAIATDGPSARVLGLVVDTAVPVSMVGAVLTKGKVEQDTVLWDALTGWSGGLIAGKDYFVRSDLVGGITHIPPDGDDFYVTKVGKAVSPTVLDINIEPPIEL